jgi:hypothetical protein
MMTREEVLKKILVDMRSKRKFALDMAKDSALEALTGMQEHRAEKEDEAIKLHRRSATWDDAIISVEYYLEGPGRVE